jgi:hypothetical protein
MTGFSVPTELILSSEAPGEGVGLGVGRVDGGAPDVDGGGVSFGVHGTLFSGGCGFVPLPITEGFCTM